MAIPVTEDEMEAIRLLNAAGSTTSTKLAEKILDRYFETRDRSRSLRSTLRPVTKTLSDYKEVAQEALEQKEAQEKQDFLTDFQQKGARARVKYTSEEKAKWHELASNMKEGLSISAKARRIIREMRYEDGAFDNVRRELRKKVGQSL